ncbi:unnamed protein product, partial [Hapterophycus canaliculatus]
RSYANSGDWNSSLSSGSGNSPSRKRLGSSGEGGGGGGGQGSMNTFPTFSRNSSSSSNGSSPRAMEAKTGAAVAILSSAVYLWDFFLSADSHASLGLARDTSAYRTLKELLEDSVPGAGGGGTGEGADGKGKTTEQGPRPGRDARVDHAVSVGKALLDMQRHVLRKLCASVYPDFQASLCYEHLCSELTTGPRSPARLPPGPPDDSDFTPPSPRDAAAEAAAGAGGLPGSSEPSSWTTSGPAVVPSSPPRRAQAPPPLRQKMLLQQQQQQQHGGSGGRNGGGGGGGGGGAGGASERSREKPRSPFAFLGGGSPPRDSPREGDRDRVAWDGTRRSSAPGGTPGGAAGRGPGTVAVPAGRGALGSGRGGAFGGHPSTPDEDVPRPPVQGGARGVGAVSGPQFDLLWRASRGWVLEKVMRRVELPSHVSRHRPPWDRAGQEQGRGRRGGGEEAGKGRRFSRRDSGPVVVPVSPRLHEHLSLPHATRRLGRRPYSIASSPNSASSCMDVPAISLHSGDSGGGGSSHGGGTMTGDWELTSPPDVMGRKPSFGVGENRGSEPTFGGRKGVGGGNGGSGGFVQEEMRGCAEWAVTFAGSLNQGITTVK